MKLLEEIHKEDKKIILSERRCDEWVRQHMLDMTAKY